MEKESSKFQKRSPPLDLERLVLHWSLDVGVWSFRNDQDRFSALKTAFTDANSIFVSTPAPQRALPSAYLI
jgi:hypothetical protein